MAEYGVEWRCGTLYDKDGSWAFDSPIGSKSPNGPVEQVHNLNRCWIVGVLW